MQEQESFIALCKVVDTLLGEGGCPWDKAQTHKSLQPHFLEECDEVIEAINQGDMAALQEELGDVLLHILFHGRIAEKEGQFTLADIFEQLREKLIRRHTHIFGTDRASTPEEAIKIWKANKQKEKK